MKSPKVLVVCAAWAMFLIADQTLAAESVSSFATFYGIDADVDWLTSALVAIAVGLLVLLGLAVAWPATIAAIGSSIGGFYGLSGAAATNFGLALLGGGSIAAGGGGIAVGSALLAMALTFGTEVTIDYSIAQVSAAYDRKAFERESLAMMTLPIPAAIDTGGLKSLEAAKKIMENTISSSAYDCVRSMPQDFAALADCLKKKQGRLRSDLTREAIAAIERYENRDAMTLEDVDRKNTAIALLKFLDNDYREAAEVAQQVYESARRNKRHRTIPAFLMSVERLYASDPNFAAAHELFAYSVLQEPKNPLVPILFATYLDRLSARVNQGAAGNEDLERAVTVAHQLPKGEGRLIVQQALLTHFLKHTKMTQQKVLSLTSMTGLTPAQRATARNAAREASKQHWEFIKTANVLLRRQETLIDDLDRPASMRERIEDGNNPFSDEPTQRQKLLRNLKESLASYRQAIAKYEWAKYDVKRLAERF